jgi:hypothetical protein
MRFQKILISPNFVLLQDAEVSYLENSDTKVQTIKAEGSKCQLCWKINKDACSRKTCPKRSE